MSESKVIELASQYNLLWEVLNDLKLGYTPEEIVENYCLYD